MKSFRDPCDLCGGKIPVTDDPYAFHFVHVHELTCPKHPQYERNRMVEALQLANDFLTEVMTWGPYSVAGMDFTAATTN